jgi:hypothetical protein
VTATLVRRASARKPTSLAALERTKLMTTASFSRPWKPSTVPTSSEGSVGSSRSRSSATCAE